MSYNVPSTTPERLSFGPGIVYIGAVGHTPTTDVGAVDAGMTLTHATEVLDVYQGTPRRLIKSFRPQETVTFAFTGFEWNVNRLPDYVGAGSVSGDEYSFGGDMLFNEVSLRMIHQTPPEAGATVGNTIIIDVWKARANGDLALTFGAELHNQPVTFTSLQATTNWANASLSQGAESYKITIQTAP